MQSPSKRGGTKIGQRSSTRSTIKTPKKLPGLRVKMNPPDWVREFLAEMTGTLTLVMVGQCCLACYLLDPGGHFDLFAVAIAFGVAAMVSVAAMAPISGSHLNPAVTLAFAVIGRIPTFKVPHYFIAQYMGGFLASVFTYLTYFEAIHDYEHRHKNVTGPWGSMAVFTTFPAPWISPIGAIGDQIIATATLMFGVLAITDPRSGIKTSQHPFMLGLLITGMVLAFGLNCGAALNPARDLAPRIFLLVRGHIRAFRPVASLYWLLAGVAGPHIGAILAAAIYQFLVIHPEKPEENTDKTTTSTTL